MAARRKKQTASAASILPKVDIFNGDLNALISVMEKHEKSQYESIIIPNINLSFKGGAEFKFKDYINALQSGTADYYNAYLKAKRELNLTCAGSEHIYMQDVEGLFFDTGLYLSGEPECFYNVQAAESSKIVDIYYNISAPYTVTEKQYFNKLLPVLNLIDELEASGTRCNIYAIVDAEGYQKSGTYGYKFKLCIKKANEVLNFQQISTLICSPILLRFCCFYLSSDYNGEKLGRNYTDWTTETKYINSTDSIYIPSFYWDDEKYIKNHSELTTIYPHLKNQIL